jgi:predicted thioesterase
MMAACMAGALCLANVALAQTPASPAKGGGVGNTVKVTATVTKIDQATREISLKAADGQVYTFVADDAVQNFAQIKKGDVVTAAYTEALAYEVKKGGNAAVAATFAGAAAEPGAKPAGAVGGKVTLTVVITKIDTKVPSITVKAANGEKQTVKVMDPERLQGVNVGDTVEITYTQAIALKVEKASKN